MDRLSPSPVLWLAKHATVQCVVSDAEIDDSCRIFKSSRFHNRKNAFNRLLEVTRITSTKKKGSQKFN